VSTSFSATALSTRGISLRIPRLPKRRSSAISSAVPSAGRSSRIAHFSLPTTKASGKPRELPTLTLSPLRQLATETWSPGRWTVDPASQKVSGTLSCLHLYRVGRLSGLFSMDSRSSTKTFFTARIDHKFSDRDSLFGTYLYDKTPYNSPDSFGNVGLNSLSSRQIVAVEETHSFTPTFINAVRFGFNHETGRQRPPAVKAINPAASDTSLAAFAGRDAGFRKTSPGFSALPGGVGWTSYLSLPLELLPGL